MLAISRILPTFLQQVFAVCKGLIFVLGTLQEKVEFTPSRGSKSIENIGEDRTVEYMPKKMLQVHLLTGALVLISWILATFKQQSNLTLSLSVK